MDLYSNVSQGNISEEPFNKNLDIPELEQFDNNILVIPDIHILAKEPKNRNQMMISRQLKVLTELHSLIKSNKITGVIFLGDIYDRGFPDCSYNYTSTTVSKIKDISKAVNGMCFSVLGNHEISYAKDNVFYSIANITSDIVKEQIVGLETPKQIDSCIQVPSMIDFGNVKIYLMHFRKHNKAYKISKDNKNTIGLYHDDLVTFESKMNLYHHRLGNGISVSNTDIFDNVDWAIIGHIHTPLLTFNLNNSRQTVIDVPGAIIARTVAEEHDRIKLPIISINKTGFVRNYFDFSIGDFKETVNTEMVKVESQKREMSKFIKQEVSTFQKEDFEDFIKNIQDPTIREYIVSAINPLKLNSISKYTRWVNNL